MTTETDYTALAIELEEFINNQAECQFSLAKIPSLADWLRNRVIMLSSQQPECRNPNHALTDGSPSPHEIGASCMAEVPPSTKRA